ncbi:MAG: tetratricopeptide repeat protein [Fimbriimonadaceae bacterium]|nr:tetratricopeptide repeat protein [Fimbriimonadaceae bacterium]
MKTETLVQEIRELIRNQNMLAAQELLLQALNEYPDLPDLHILQGMLHCYTQKENEAVDCLENGADSALAPELAKLLSDYYHCRRLMVSKLGASDKGADKIEARIRKFAPAKPTGVGIKLSACLIVKNEENHLERCLKSIEGHVDEIVVVDTGSTDRTVEIAESFGAKIGHFEWCDDFSAARNESLKLATGDWALWIDADEEVDPKSWKTISEALTRPQFGGYFIEIVNFIRDNSEADRFTHCPVRLFRLVDGIKFTGRIHEQVTPALDELGLPNARLENARMNHYGYVPSMMEERNKAERTIRMLEQEVRESPNDAFHWFNLANAYHVGQKHENAVQAAKMSLRFMHPGNGFIGLVYQLYAGSLTALGRPEEALAVCQEAKQAGQFSIINAFEEAHALYRLERFEGALSAVNACMAMPWEAGSTGDYGIVTYKSHLLKGKILGGMGRYEEALDWIGQALSVDPGFAIAIYQKGWTLERLGRYEEAVQVLKSLECDAFWAVPAMSIIGQCLHELGRSDDAAKYFESAWRIDPANVSLWVSWVKICEASGDAQSMIRAYEAYSKHHDPNTDVLINWGRALAATGDNEKAMHCFTEAIKRDPANPNSYFNFGDFLYSVGQYADAAQIYENGLRIDSGNAQAWFVMGNCLAQLNLLAAAQSSYHQALSLQPGHSQAEHNLRIVSGASGLAETAA